MDNQNNNDFYRQQYIPQQQYNPQGQYMQPGQMPQQSLMSQQDRNNSTILCVISLLCHFVVPSVSLFILSFFGSGDIDSSNDVITSLGSCISGLSYMASWVLMIIARIKYPKSVFAKVIMWIYIGILALGVIAFIILLASCIKCLSDCRGF